MLVFVPNHLFIIGGDFIKRLIITILLSTVSFIGGNTICLFTNSAVHASSSENEEVKQDNLDNIWSKLSDTFTPKSEEEKNAPPSNLEELYTKAKSVSSKTVGWINISNSNINYPIVQGSNNYYLNNSYDDKPTVAGAIFLDENCSGFNGISMIHGHNMSNGSMFADLRVYYTRGVIQKTDKIYLYDGTQMLTYTIFSAFKTDPSIEFPLKNSDPAALKSFAQQMKDKSHCSCEEKYTVTDKPVLILNTCVSDGTSQHYIVVAQQV